MKQNLTYDLPKLETSRYENIFNVYTDDEQRYFYNILQSIAFPDNLMDSFFDYYVIEPNDAWSLISYKNYGTINLWWIITLANNITNPLSELKSGDILKIPKSNVVREVLNQIIK